MKILIAETGQHVIEAVKYYRRMGHEIILARSSKKAISQKFFNSRYINHIVTYPEDLDGIEEIVEIQKIYENKKCDVFFPFGFDLVTKYITSIQKNLKCRMNTPYMDGCGYWQLSDKEKIYNTVSQTSVHIPKIIGIINGSDTISLNISDYPVIVKRKQGVGIIDNVCLAWNNDDIIKFIAKNQFKGNSIDEFVIQEYIPGDAFDVGGFALMGEIYYAVPQRRTITLPLRGGVAAVNDIYPDKKLIDHASEIIKVSKWTGPFQAEFRWNPQDEEYYLIEVNAKMWGSLPLSLLSNSDILAIALDVALGKSPQKSLEYKKNLRYRWICRQELLAISKGDVNDIIDFLSRFSKKSHYDFNIADPYYSLISLFHTLYTIIIKRDRIVSPLLTKTHHKKLNSKKN